MALSVLWSVYAAVLMAAIGFIRRAPAIRWAALSLFALTVVKVMLIDIAVLESALSHHRFPRARSVAADGGLGLSQSLSFEGVVNMKRRAFILSIAIVAALAGVAVIAQTAISSWPFFVEVTPVGAGINQFAVPLHVLDKAGQDLADLRLYDANSREIPYAVRIRAGEDDAEEIDGRLFNQAKIGSTASEASIDLGEDPGEHNEVEIETEGMNFRRSVEVEGSDTGTDWKTLSTGSVIFSFGSASSTARSNRVSYPVSRYRYLRVRVFADKPRDEQPPVITAVKVLMGRREKSEITTWQVSRPDYQLLRRNSAPASSWTLDLGARCPAIGFCWRCKMNPSRDLSKSRLLTIRITSDW